MSDWKRTYRSFYYETAEDPEDPVLIPAETALLVIDIQNTYMEVQEDAVEAERWRPFRERMLDIVIPNTVELIEQSRAVGFEIMFSRIACLTSNGRDRSLSQKKPGFNYLLLPKDEKESQLVPELEPGQDDIVVLKTTDSSLTGTNLRLILHNIGICNVVVAGIFTDQCISSTVRSLADESLNVLVVENCCAASTMELHNHELDVLNMIYCHVVQSEDIPTFIPG